ncbi:MAG: cobalamin biosynthesis protein CbiD [Deltaproteobacteria bacterium]|nr:MAG: cobalamin biosynthesis protein CbiD [Deltaproteobacteria bacterium]
MARKRSRLRTGFTTGTAAAAATRAALTLLVTGTAPAQVRIPFLSEGSVRITPKSCTRLSADAAVCDVEKDAGDDPDITHRAIIRATVTLKPHHTVEVTILGGDGVGRVTRPGLGLPVGGPSITEGPRTMICAAVTDVLQSAGYPAHVITRISVPNGEKLAEKTLNHRLGITGGISILGTTGIVTPLSHDAYRATIRAGVSVAAAEKTAAVVLTTGRRTEKMAMALWNELPEPAFIQMGDFVAFSIASAVDAGFTDIRMGLFFGKTVKIAMGYPHTHAAKSRLSLDWLAARVPDKHPVLKQAVQTANTARHALGLIKDTAPQVLPRVLEAAAVSVRSFAKSDTAFRLVLFDFNGAILTSVTDTAKETPHA